MQPPTSEQPYTQEFMRVACFSTTDASHGHTLPALGQVCSIWKEARNSWWPYCNSPVGLYCEQDMTKLDSNMVYCPCLQITAWTIESIGISSCLIALMVWRQDDRTLWTQQQAYDCVNHRNSCAKHSSYIQGNCLSYNRHFRITTALKWSYEVFDFSWPPVLAVTCWQYMTWSKQ